MASETPTWMLCLPEQTREWISQAPADVLEHPLLRVALVRHMFEAQTDVLLAKIVGEVRAESRSFEVHAPERHRRLAEEAERILRLHMDGQGTGGMS